MELEGNSKLRNIGSLPGAVAGEALRAAERDLGQCPGAPRRGGEGISPDTRAEPEAGESAGYSPDFNADEAIWGWAREEATGNLCLGTREAVLERVGSFLTGLASRKDEVRRRCRTVLQSRAEALPPDSQPHSRPQANAHPPWLWFSTTVADPEKVEFQATKEC